MAPPKMQRMESKMADDESEAMNQASPGPSNQSSTDHEPDDADLPQEMPNLENLCLDDKVLQHLQEMNKPGAANVTALTGSTKQKCRDALRFLLKTTKDMKFPQQKRLVFHVLKSNPELMKAFIREWKSSRITNSTSVPKKLL